MLKALVDIFFPHICPLCRGVVVREGEGFCRICLEGFKAVASPLCTRCGIPFGSFEGDGGKEAEGDRRVTADHLCGECASDEPVFEMARSAVYYSGEAARALWRLKYGGKMSVAPALGGITADLAERVLSGAGEGGAGDAGVGEGGGTPVEVDLVVPVPLHVRRLRERSFNQSQLLAGAVARRVGKGVEASVLKRVRETAPQVSLTGRERRANVKDAFLVAAPRSVAGTTVLLVDDVITTGATVRECAKALGKAGAETYVLSLARAAPLW